MCNRDTCIEYQLVDPMLQEAMTLQEVSCGESKQELSIQKPSMRQFISIK